MPHHQDVADDAETKSTYECLVCGTIVKAESHPGECSECDGEFQNRAMSLE
ncbi:rubrerythrin-like domain-containing protein [Halosimplex litoreum]|uniref:Rubrerythrin-like domain-containing protein n=1 Tax=Halosimplex litoreum TaxID=1198301 RepID=A0A7U3WT87_9EURY|nr:rubrerythrin-like domain-containing protein [Halosimplex litoreum]QPV65151.1 rubrerythrin-like domain-containing protein [Halosimplex litoreum]